MHSTAVNIVRFTLALLCFHLSSLPTRTLTEPSMGSTTPVSSMLYTFSASIAGSRNAFPITPNQCVIFPAIFVSWPFQSRAVTRLAAVSGWHFSRAFGQFLPGGSRSLTDEGRARVATKARKGMCLIRTGWPRSDMCKMHLTSALSSHGVRYSWLSALPSFEGPPWSRRWRALQATPPWSSRVCYDLRTPERTPRANTCLVLSITVGCGLQYRDCLIA